MSKNLQSKQNKTLLPKLDIIFQAIFGEVGSEKVTKRFLEAILKEKINEIDLSKNPLLRREQKEGKLGILDVIAQINGSQNCNIEVQLIKQKNIIERILYYWSKVYTRELKTGQEYEKLKKTISILIADFEIKGLEELKYHTEWKIIEKEERKIILTDKFELHIMELPKVIRNNESEDELIDWLIFLQNPNAERVRRKMQENEELREAVEKVNTMSEDEYMQRIADLREKAILDENSLKNEGIQEEKIRLAKKMREKGIPIETIIEITELTKEQILSNSN